MTRLTTMQVTIEEICLIERLRNARNSLKSGGKCVIMVEVEADGGLVGWWWSGKREQATREKQHHPGYKLNVRIEDD